VLPTQSSYGSNGSGGPAAPGAPSRTPGPRSSSLKARAFACDQRNTIGTRELDTIVRRTSPLAQAVSTRAWLSATRRAVPGGPRAPTPRRVLTATRDFVLRYRYARLGRCHLSALFYTVRAHDVPVAVSSAARHALPDPSYHPVHAADSHHTPECKIRAAEQRFRTAVCRAAPLLSARRAVTRRDAP